MAGFLERLLGHTDRRSPYRATVTYGGAATDSFALWAADMREALELTMKLMPSREAIPTRIEVQVQER